MLMHFIGIGGIGMSSLAQWYLSKEHKVSGSDLERSQITDFLKKKGIKIFIGQKASNITKNIDLVVYSPAVPESNPELKKAKDYGIRVMSYPEALGELTKNHYTIAIAGSHGKSTTTAMVSLILIKAGLDPTVVVGTKLKEFGNSNFRIGKSKYLVIEACEYDGSFLHYSPDIAVVTNIDKEHMDYFKTMNRVYKSFKDFVMRLPKSGFLIINKKDSKILKLINLKSIKNSNFKIQSYFSNLSDVERMKNILKIPGEHNIKNALAALQVARNLKIKDTVSLKALSEYKGSWRRFEIIKEKPYTIISDYGHHPTEVLATLKGVKEKYQNYLPAHKATARQGKIWLIFQPHQHQRTHYLFSDFVKIFKKNLVDKAIITDIYDVAGREKAEINFSVSSEKLVEKINSKNVVYMNIKKVEKFVAENISKGDVLVIMGAGDVYKLCDKF